MSESGKAQRERIKRIINGLRQKTEANGCTEEEALANAAKIGELLEKYDLTMEETDVREDAASCRKVELYAPDGFAGTLITGIGVFCTLVVYQTTGAGHAMRYTMFGTPQDLEMGEYLYEICAEAMEHGWTQYMDSYGYSMEKRKSFRAGFASRVTRRLREMKAARDAAVAATGTALVVLKDQLVKSEWAKVGIKLHKGSGTTIRDGHAFDQGRAAGDRVNLNRPLGTAAAGGRLR